MRLLAPRLASVALVLGSIGACRQAASPPDAANAAGQPASAATRGYLPGAYPAPRWPSCLKAPTSIDDLMPAARALVRTKSGLLGVGMGVLKSGESVLLIPNAASDPLVITAIARALDERRITVHLQYTYELLGQTREAALRQRDELRRGRDISQAGVYQASQWITGQFPDPTEPKQWLKARRPDRYPELFPGEGGALPLSSAREMSEVGAALQEFLHYPGLNDRVYPYPTKPRFRYLYDIAIGTHPKAFRATPPLVEDGNTVAERARSGVIHWGLGIRLWHDPDAPTESKVWADFTKTYNVPFDHGWHTHTYFTTDQVRLRSANRWVTLQEKGHMKPLDDPKVRALASRYGDPDYLLTEDRIPEVPGIDGPGDYQTDYAPHPGAYALARLDHATKGTYGHSFPLVAPSPGAASAAATPGGR